MKRYHRLYREKELWSPEAWRGQLQRDRFYPYKWGRESTVVVRSLSPHTGETILDAGCGFGRFAEQIVRHGAQVMGLDIITQNIQYCKQQLGNTFQGAVADLSAIPTHDNSFDKAICIGVLVHVEDPLVVLEELHRILKEGGILVTVNNNSLLFYCSLFYMTVLGVYDLLARFGFVERRQYILRYKSPFWYARLLRKAGFEVEEINGDSFLGTIRLKRYTLFPPAFSLPFFKILDKVSQTTPFKYFCYASVIRARKKPA
jgi:ubiquinone/menaquinone biosynthesis C-methylase UbiE